MDREIHITQNLKEHQGYLRLLNKDVAYYLDLAENKLRDIETIERTIHDLKQQIKNIEDEYAKEGGD